MKALRQEKKIVFAEAHAIAHNKFMVIVRMVHKRCKSVIFRKLTR